MMHHILTFLSTYYTSFLALTKANPVVGGIVSLWGLGILTFILKDIPATVWNFIKEQSTTSVTFNSQDDAYYLFLTYLSKNKLHSYMRRYNLSGLSNYGTHESVFTVGYGETFVFYNYMPIFINRYRVEGNVTEKAKEIMVATVLGRSTKLLNSLIEETKKVNEDPNSFKVYRYHEGYWYHLANTQTRSLDSLAFPKRIINKLTTHIDDYLSSKEWFLKHGIIYKTGILLQGPPGTGKTSLVTAMCSKYKKNCYLVDLNNLNDDSLKRAIATVPRGQVILMEDIDAYFSNRENGKSVVSEIKEIQGCSLIGILNALDGIACGTDRIVFATTNHPENLDPALIREGRFDLKVAIDNMEDEVFKEYFHGFYPSFSKAELENWRIKLNTPPCKVQQLIFENRHDPMVVLHAVAANYKQSLKMSDK